MERRVTKGKLKDELNMKRKVKQEKVNVCKRVIAFIHRFCNYTNKYFTYIMMECNGCKVREQRGYNAWVSAARINNISHL